MKRPQSPFDFVNFGLPACYFTLLVVLELYSIQSSFQVPPPSIHQYLPTNLPSAPSYIYLRDIIIKYLQTIADYCRLLQTITNSYNPLQNTLDYTKSFNTSFKMADNSLKSIFNSAERQRLAIESSWETNTEQYQEAVRNALSAYQECRELADSLALFSPNETLEDINSSDIQYAHI